MRILQILPELHVGGVETGTVDFAKYLQRQGHYNIVVSNGGALVEDLEREGIRHYQLPVHKKSLWTMVRCVKRLRRIILEEKIEIVHARSRVPAWIAFFACRSTEAQFITTCHGYYRQGFMSRVMGWAKIVIVPSEVIGRHMIDDFKVPPENIRFIPRSVDLTKFVARHEQTPGKNKPVIAIVGRLTPLKGHIFFIRAIAKLVRSMPFIRVWIIGDAPAGKEAYRKELEAMVRHLGLTEVVEFLGHRKDVPQLLAQADVLVLASIVPESFGRVIVEAQAAGIPVVATSVGGVVEIIDDERTGLLVLPKDPDGMAQAVFRVLNEPKLAARIVEAAQQKLESHFTLDQMGGRTLAAYEELRVSQNILVIKVSSLGDVILITPSLRALRKKYPHAKIHVLIGQQWRHILQRCPYIDELIVVDFKDLGWPALLKLGERLRQYKFDKVIDFQNNRRSHLLAALSFPRASYGFNNGKWGFLLTRKVRKPNNVLAPVPHQFQIMELLDIPYKPDMLLELWPSERDKKNIQKLLESEWIGEGTLVVGINLAASAKWPTKNWPVEYMARLCDLLAQENIRVVLTGLEKDRPLAQQLQKMTKSKVANFVGKTDLMELVALVKRCQVFISPDSAPLHMAAAMRTPFIAFFGPTSSARHLPPAKNGVVFERKLKCAPCYGKVCKIKTHACMREILPEEVAREVQRLIKEPAA